MCGPPWRKKEGRAAVPTSGVGGGGFRGGGQRRSGNGRQRHAAHARVPVEQDFEHDGVAWPVAVSGVSPR